jgi:ferredoxin
MSSTSTSASSAAPASTAARSKPLSRNEEGLKMSDVTVKINGKQVSVPSGSTILEAAQKLNINIPILC